MAEKYGPHIPGIIIFFLLRIMWHAEVPLIKHSVDSIFCTGKSFSVTLIMKQIIRFGHILAIQNCPPFFCFNMLVEISTNATTIQELHIVLGSNLSHKQAKKIAKPRASPGILRMSGDDDYKVTTRTAEQAHG